MLYPFESTRTDLNSAADWKKTGAHDSIVFDPSLLTVKEDNTYLEQFSLDAVVRTTQITNTFPLIFLSLDFADPCVLHCSHLRKGSLQLGFPFPSRTRHLLAGFRFHTALFCPLSEYRQHFPTLCQNTDTSSLPCQNTNDIILAVGLVRRCAAGVLLSQHLSGRPRHSRQLQQVPAQRLQVRTVVLA